MKIIYHPFIPNEWQRKAFLDTSPIVLLSGTAGSGKSRIAGEKAHAYALKYPGASILFTKKTFSSLRNTMLIPFENEVLQGCPYVKPLKSENCYVYDNGSRIFYAGMANEKERERIRGIGLQGGLDYIWADEANAFLREDLQELFPRMRGKAASWKQIFMTTNPDSPGHHLYQDFILTKKANIYYSSYKDNKYNPNDYEEQLMMMSGIQALRLREGLWVQAEGAVYADFRRDIHIIRRFEISPHWRRIRSIDFGYKNAFVCQWWAIDHDGRMYLYRELYQTEKIVEDHARRIMELSQGEKIEATIADHDAEDRATLARHGISTMAAFKMVTPGVQNIQSRLPVQKDGKPRLMIFEDALIDPDRKLIEVKKPYATIQEFDRYIYAKPKENRPLEEEPLKEDDHGMDAMRYAAAYIDNLQEEYTPIVTSSVLAQSVSKTFEHLYLPKHHFRSEPQDKEFWPNQ